MTGHLHECASFERHVDGVWVTYDTATSQEIQVGLVSSHTITLSSYILLRRPVTIGRARPAGRLVPTA